MISWERSPRTPLVRAVTVAIAMAACDPALGLHQMNVSIWLDQAKAVPWNAPGEPLPLAPRLQAAVDPRCRWGVLVIRGTAAYDGMCRPRRYQDFVFVRGVFAGTLSPQPTDSRTDGALGRVFLRSDRRLMAEYVRYARTDPLCCPSRTTNVTFEIEGDPPVVRPVSASTTIR